MYRGQDKMFSGRVIFYEKMVLYNSLRIILYFWKGIVKDACPE